MKKDIHAQGDQFVISYELLHVLYWLLKYEEVELSKLINKSFSKGIQEKMKHADALTDLRLSEEMQNSIIDFFTFMEQEISDITNQESTKMMNQNLIKDLDHVDPKQIDYSTVKTTLSKNVEKLHTQKYHGKTRSHFFKELLKHWKPQKEKNKKGLLN